MKEIWKDIPGYIGLYKVSTFGRIYSLISNKILKLQTNTYRRWYINVWLFREGKCKRITVHRLVAITFIDNIKNKPCVNHIDGVKSNNNLGNLEWCTHKENTKHKFDMWLQWDYTKMWWIWINLCKPISQYTKLWLHIQDWASSKEASLELWIHQASICSAVKWRQKTAWNFVWKFIT